MNVVIIAGIAFYVGVAVGVFVISLFVSAKGSRRIAKDDRRKSGRMRKGGGS